MDSDGVLQGARPCTSLGHVLQALAQRLQEQYQDLPAAASDDR